MFTSPGPRFSIDNDTSVVLRVIRVTKLFRSQALMAVLKQKNEDLYNGDLMGFNVIYPII